MKTLETIQKLAKIGRFVSKLVMIICIIGAVGTAIGIAGLAASGGEELSIGGMKIADAFPADADVNLPTALAAMAVGLVTCIAEIIMSKYSANYFTHELEDGTPFTERGADELKRLGIVCIVTSVVASVICGGGLAAASLKFPEIAEADIEGVSGLAIGVVFLVVSLLCRLGAQSKPTATAVPEAAAPEVPAATEVPEVPEAAPEVVEAVPEEAAAPDTAE